MSETNAPLSELRVAKYLRRYERVKLALMCIVLLVVLVSCLYLIALGRSNHESLVILRCAVDKTVQFDSHGHARTQEASRRVFDACVAKG